MCNRDASQDCVKKFETILKMAEKIVEDLANSPVYEDTIRRAGVRVNLIQIGEYYLLRSNVTGKLFNLSSSLENANEDFNLIESNKD